MTLAPLRLPPGISRNGTKYQAKGRWYDAPYIRFYSQTIRPVGGVVTLNETIPEVPAVNGTVHGLETATHANGTAVAGTSADSGFGLWEAGIGCFALSASYQGNRIQRTGNGSGGMTLHRFNNTGLDMTGTELFFDSTRPADIANDKAGLFARGDGSQFNAAVATRGCFFYYERTNGATVQLVWFGPDNAGTTQSVTVQTGIAFAAAGRLRIGMTMTDTGSGTSFQLWTEPVGGGTRTLQGSPVVVDAAHDLHGQSYCGAVVNLGVTSGQEWDNITLKNPDTPLIPAYQIPVALTGVCRALLAWRNGNVPSLVLGTNSKIYTFVQGALVDRTISDLTTGAVNSVSVVGQYGAGNYGSYNYGEGDTLQATLVDAASWQIDAFGNYPVGVLTSDGRLLYWDGLTDDFTDVGDLPGITGTVPVNNVGVVVTNERFLFALGADGNPRLLRWPSMETLDDWDDTDPTNSASFYELPGEGKIMCGRRGKDETLIFTDVDMFVAQYVGGDLLYGFPQKGSKCGIVSRHAVSVIDGRAIWMGVNGFFEYNGFVRQIENCEVQDYVFKDFNRTQRAKCFSVPITQYGEVEFYYCSAGSDEIDRKAVYNYIENHWNAYPLSRTAGIDKGVFDFPIFVNLAAAYEHEKGTDKDGTPRLESGPVELGEGDRVMDIDSIVPDEATTGGQSLGSLQVSLFTSEYPNSTDATDPSLSDEIENGPYTLAARTDVRLCARVVRLMMEEIVAADWRIGVVRLDVQPGSER